MRSIRRTLVLAGAAALALTGCAASVTPYQPAGAGRTSGGYSDIRLSEDRYRVTFAGNQFTSRDTVEGYLLYRAAELTLEQGHDWFRILDEELEHEVRERVVPDPFYDPWYGYGYWRPYWRYYGRGVGWRSWYPGYGDPFWASHVDVQTVERFEASAEIALGRGPMPTDGGKLFDAREVVARLGPTIRRSRP